MPIQELERTQLELMNVRKEAQIHISTLKGKISELVHMNSMLGKKVEEQSCLVETRLKRVDDQCVVISSLRMSLNTTVIDSNGAGVGVGDPPQASEGPPVFSIATPQEGLSSASAAGPNRLLLPHSTSVIPNQDLHSAAASALPLGTAGGARGNGHDSQSGMPQSRKDLETLVKQLMTGHLSSNRAIPATAVHSAKHSPLLNARRGRRRNTGDLSDISWLSSRPFQWTRKTCQPGLG